MRVTGVRLINYRCFDDTDEIQLGDVNIIIGRNNSGKSALLRGLYDLQAAGATDLDRRIGARSHEVHGTFVDWGPNYPFTGSHRYPTGDSLRLVRRWEGSGAHMELTDSSRTDVDVSFNIPNFGTDAFFIPIGNRRPSSYDERIDLGAADTIEPGQRYLAAKLDRTTNSDNRASDTFREAMQRIVGRPVTAVLSGGGKLPGIVVENKHIYLERMGAGIANVAELLVMMIGQSNHCFLIEEPENDLHPAALKALMEVMLENRVGNQFVVSTHSHIVLGALGAFEDARVLEVRAVGGNDPVPLSRVHSVPPDPRARRRVLENLGYELRDFGIYDGYLLLEESSAQRIIEEFLIPWFAPGLLGRLRIVSCGGTGNVEKFFQDLARLFLFVHLEHAYLGRAWVRVDGDPSGVEVVEKLTNRYTDWPAGTFDYWQRESLETYYPPRFDEAVRSVRELHHNDQRSAKKELLETVLEWCRQHRAEAQQEFEVSAAEIIASLRDIEGSILRRPSLSVEAPEA